MKSQSISRLKSDRFREGPCNCFNAKVVNWPLTYESYDGVFCSSETAPKLPLAANAGVTSPLSAMRHVTPYCYEKAREQIYLSIYKIETSAVGARI